MSLSLRRSIGTLMICAWIICGAATASWATAPRSHEVRESSTGPPDCTFGAVAPVRRGDRLVARGLTECYEGEASYLRIRVQMQRRVAGEWVIEAAAIGSTFAPSEEFMVKVSRSCMAGRYRTWVVFRYRWDVTDRWRQAWPAFDSPHTVIRCGQ